MSEARPDRIHRVTANYFFWQGLRWLPGGFVLATAGFLWSEWWPFTGWVEDGILIAVLLASIGSSMAIGRYYQRAFGEVRGVPHEHVRRTRIKWLIVYPLMAGSLLVDGLAKPPFLLSGIVWGAAIVAYWWSTGRGRNHYVVAASILLAMSLLPTLGTVAAGPPSLSLFFIMVGGIYIVGGVLDHFELRQLLPPVPADTEAEDR